MSDWIIAKQRWSSFVAKPGMLLDVGTEGKPAICLVGDINIMGGTCNHCDSLDNTTTVYRYKMVYEPSQE